MLKYIAHALICILLSYTPPGFEVIPVPLVVQSPVQSEDEQSPEPDFFNPDTFQESMAIKACEPIEPAVCGSNFYPEDQQRCTNFI